MEWAGEAKKKKEKKLLPQKVTPASQFPGGRAGRAGEEKREEVSSRKVTTLHLAELPLPARQSFCFFPDSIPGDQFPPPRRSAE